MRSQKIHVCFVCPGADALFCPERGGGHGGAEAQIYLMARELARHDEADVHVLVRGESRRPSETREGCRIHFIPFNAGLNSKIQLQRKLARIGADVYIQRGIGSLTKEIAFFCLWRRRRFVYWIASEYDVNPEAKIEELDRGRWFEWGMNRADVIVAQTRRQRDLLKNRTGRDAVVIPNGFPRREVPPSERDAVIWVGRFVPFKRPELFIELARQIPDERFVMIAPLADPAAGALYQRLRPAIETTPNLEHVPGAPFEEIGSYFDRSKLLVNTSTTEGFPNTFIQAMWSRTPIASLAFDPDDIIARHGLGAPPQADLCAFAAAVRRLLSDPAEWSRCAAEARAHAEARHDIASNADLLAEHLTAFAK